MTEDGQITKKDQKKQARIGDLLQKPGLTAKEQQELSAATDPTEQLRQNGIYTNGEAPDDFEDTQAALEPNIRDNKDKDSQETVRTEQLNAAPAPLQSASDKSKNPIADEQVKHGTHPLAPVSANDDDNQTKPAKKVAAKKAATKKED